VNHPALALHGVRTMLILDEGFPEPSDPKDILIIRWMCADAAKQTDVGTKTIKGAVKDFSDYTTPNASQVVPEGGATPAGANYQLPSGQEVVAVSGPLAPPSITDSGPPGFSSAAGGATGVF
jgi:hypothetical protein